MKLKSIARATKFRIPLIQEELEDLNKSPDMEITHNLYRNALVHQLEYMELILQCLPDEDV